MAVVEFDSGDYHYKANTSNTNISSISAIDKTKTTYENIPSTVAYDGNTWSVKTLDSCFSDCTSLTTAPTIPNSVTRMEYCFKDCSSLTTAPTIPNSVTNMFQCFYKCTSLTTAPTIPNGVTNMVACFSNCSSLTTAPTIPNSVTNMAACFDNCTSLTTAPTIPSSVTNMDFCFRSCASLVGNITVNNDPSNYSNVFTNAGSTDIDYPYTSQIYIVNGGSANATTWRGIANSYQNVHYEYDDIIQPSISNFNIVRTDSASTPVFPKDDGTYAYLSFNAVKGQTGGRESGNYIPSGWSISFDYILTTDNNQFISPSWSTPQPVGVQAPYSCFINVGETSQNHTYSVQMQSLVKDSNNVTKAAYSSNTLTGVLQKFFALMDMIHDEELDSEGLAIGTQATDVGFLVGLDSAFTERVYLSTDSNDTGLISNITTLGWDSETKVQILCNSSYSFNMLGTTISFSTTPFDYDLSYSITGVDMDVAIDNTNREITIDPNATGEATLSLYCNVGGYRFTKNVSLTAWR